MAYDVVSSLLTSGVCEVYSNRVHDLSTTNTNGGRVTGIRVNLSAEAASSSRVYDNFVYGLGPLYVVKADTSTLTFDIK